MALSTHGIIFYNLTLCALGFHDKMLVLATTLAHPLAPPQSHRPVPATAAGGLALNGSLPFKSTHPGAHSLNHDRPHPRKVSAGAILVAFAGEVNCLCFAERRNRPVVARWWTVVLLSRKPRVRRANA